MLWFAAGLALPILVAYTLVASCDREAPAGLATPFLRLGLAIGMGIGLSSCTYFLWRLLGGTPGRAYQVCELAVFATVGVFGLALVHSSSKSTGESRSSGRRRLGLTIRPLGGWQTLLAITFVAALVLAGMGALGSYWKEPLGDWDAWAIWNQRARFFFRAGDAWRQAFSGVFVHADYPLLLPCGNARLWSYLGTDPTWVPWLVGSLFTFAAVGVLAAGLCRLRSRGQGLLAGMTLLGTIPFLERGTLQYADVPLAFFILSAVLFLVLYDASGQGTVPIFVSTGYRPKVGLGLSLLTQELSSRAESRQPSEQRHRGFLVLSGLTAGLAAWTKNEGLLLLVALPVARCTVAWRRAQARRALKELAYWIASALPVLILLGIQKTCLAGGNEFVTGQGWNAFVDRLCDPSRYWCVAQAFLLYGLRIARPFVVVLPLLFLFLGMVNRHLGGNFGLSTATGTLLLMLTGYFFIYLATPCDLQWHLLSSAERLLLQLWPLCLLVLFLCLATPEECSLREQEQ